MVATCRGATTMSMKAFLSALVLTTTFAAVPVAAQPYSNDFWRGAPDGLQQRIDWLQQRISRGTSDGSLDPQEARRAQYQLDSLRRDASVLQQRLDDLSRNIRWARSGGYGSRYGYSDRAYGRDN